MCVISEPKCPQFWQKCPHAPCVPRAAFSSSALPYTYIWLIGGYNSLLLRFKASLANDECRKSRVFTISYYRYYRKNLLLSLSLLLSGKNGLSVIPAIHYTAVTIVNEHAWLQLVDLLFIQLDIFIQNTSRDMVCNMSNIHWFSNVLKMYCTL
jgi:hypothetical protein